jgi:hypothetical protein
MLLPQLLLRNQQHPLPTKVHTATAAYTSLETESNITSILYLLAEPTSTECLLIFFFLKGKKPNQAETPFMFVPSSSIQLSFPKSAY